jgi:uncharacterized protein (DUF1810 family)
MTDPFDLQRFLDAQARVYSPRRTVRIRRAVILAVLDWQLRSPRHSEGVRLHRFLRWGK